MIDSVWGGDGNDFVSLMACCAGQAAGPVVGGSGDDGLYTQNGLSDRQVRPGLDTARVDLTDTFVDCQVIEHEIDGDNGDNVLVGTPYNDIVRAAGGDDEISGRAGEDAVYAYAGPGLIRGGIGNDYIVASESGEPVEADTIFCGAGVDRVYADTADVVAADCEDVQMRDDG